MVAGTVYCRANGLSGEKSDFRAIPLNRATPKVTNLSSRYLIASDSLLFKQI